MYIQMYIFFPFRFIRFYSVKSSGVNSENRKNWSFKGPIFVPFRFIRFYSCFFLAQPVNRLSGVAHYKNPSQTLKSHSQPVLKKLVSLDSTTFFQGLVLLNWPRPVQRGPDFCLFGWHLLVKDPDHASGITSNKFNFV